MSSDRMSVGAPVAAIAVAAAAQRPSAPAKAAIDEKTRPASPPELQAIEAIAQRIESYLKSVSRSLEFRVDAASGRTVVSVRDSQTGDLIRQIPGEEVLRLAEMAEDQTIVLVSETA